MMKCARCAMKRRGARKKNWYLNVHSASSGMFVMNAILIGYVHKLKIKLDKNKHWYNV